MDTSNNWATTFVASTAFKYLVGIFAGWLSNKLGLDPTEGASSIGGLLSAAVGVGMLIWGAWESSRSKLVVNGTKVPVSQMSTVDKVTVAGIAAKAS